MKKLLTEFIGTFFLVFTIGLVVTQGVAMAPVAIGCILVAMVYMGGHVSGAHYNPAVSIAVLVRGKTNLQEFISYVAIQIAGAFVAAYTVYVVTGKPFVPTPSTTAGPALIVEILFTFAGGPISGGAFNPAVGLGPALCMLFFGTADISHVWIYIVGPLTGGILAGIVFNIQEK
jgi:aquaporin Z